MLIYPNIWTSDDKFCLLGLDVLRTDRTLVFYEKQENLSKLWDILAVYAWIDKDVGYCQGMWRFHMLILRENSCL